jgi:dGTPase
MITFREMQEQWEMDNLREVSKKSIEGNRWKKDETDNYRTKYQRDIGRILFSDPFRRLRMKTQIFIATGLDQHNRTRLTHSLEVAQMAKSIARPLKLNVDLAEAIALGHDLGHAPFGHAGEEALDECLKERNKGTFNHNAQSVWLVRKTLDGRKDINGDTYPGFNLTYDVTEGIWKHTDIEESVNEFDSLSFLNPEDERGSLEAQIVNLADGIAYIRHDIEDAVREDIITYEQVKEVWDNCLGIEFDKNYWIHHFVYDLIQNNQETTEIEFSKEFEKAFSKIK